MFARRLRSTIHLLQKEGEGGKKEKEKKRGEEMNTDLVWGGSLVRGISARKKREKKVKEKKKKRKSRSVCLRLIGKEGGERGKEKGKKKSEHTMAIPRRRSTNSIF